MSNFHEETYVYQSKKTPEEIKIVREFIKEVKDDFYPPLTEIVDIDSYVDKMMASAELFIAKVGDEFAGFLCMYMNDFKNFDAYLTSYAVKPEFRRKYRVAQKLIKTGIDAAGEVGMKSVKAEIDPKHRRAVMMASKFKPKLIYPEPGSGQKSILVDYTIEPK
ncbi:MAG: GNAT family N-acetyltransferase [Phycisphaerae bacterium]|nr:GNAT family N-acetyltransferase [Phycisphaerae bacterium]